MRDCLSKQNSKIKGSGVNKQVGTPVTQRNPVLEKKEESYFSLFTTHTHTLSKQC